MEFISTKGMTNETAPEGQVLVQYLEPFFGGYSTEFGIGYFDNPNDYTDGNGKGWCMWFNSNPIKVIAYAKLPSKIETEIEKLTQLQVKEKYGSNHPNLGCVGE